MRKRLAATSMIVLLAACGPAGEVTTTSPVVVETSITVSFKPVSETTDVTTVTSTTIVLGAVDAAAVAELESVLDDIDQLVNDTEDLLEEPLPSDG